MLNIEYRHSASKGNTFIDCPPFWIIHELYEHESKPNARMKMGLAAEEAAYYSLKENLSEDATTKMAKDKYILSHEGNEDDDECVWSAHIANRFVSELKQFGEMVSWQNEMQVPGKKWGLKYDVVGKTDFEFEDVIVDTKATAYIRRLKAGHVDPKWYPKEADLRQQFLYRELFGKDAMLLYCSYKDSHAVDLGDRIGYLEQLINAFKTIEHILNIAKNTEDIVRMYPLTFDNFRWKGSPDAKEFATKVWNKAFK